MARGALLCVHRRLALQRRLLPAMLLQAWLRQMPPRKMLVYRVRRYRPPGRKRKPQKTRQTHAWRWRASLRTAGRLFGLEKRGVKLGYSPTKQPRTAEFEMRICAFRSMPLEKTSRSLAIDQPHGIGIAPDRACAPRRAEPEWVRPARLAALEKLHRASSFQRQSLCREQRR